MEMKAVFLAKIELLTKMIDWIRARVSQMDFDSSTLHKVELASEEAIVNIIHHAYQGRTGEIEIDVVVFPKSHVEITVRDSGPPFDPTQQRQKMDTISSLEDRKLGGLGVFFIHKSMDEVRYHRDKNKNVLTLIKKYRTSS